MAAVLGYRGYSRIKAAIADYKRDIVRCIMVLGGDDQSYAYACKRMPAQDVTLCGGAYDTIDELRQIAMHIAAGNGVFIIYTSDYHFWRVKALLALCGMLNIDIRKVAESGPDHVRAGRMISESAKMALTVALCLPRIYHIRKIAAFEKPQCHLLMRMQRFFGVKGRKNERRNNVCVVDTFTKPQ